MPGPRAQEEYVRTLRSTLEALEQLVNDLTDHLRDLEQDFRMRAQAAIITRSLNLAITRRDDMKHELREFEGLV